MEKPATNSKRVPVKYVVFNGPVELTCYRGFVNRINSEPHGGDDAPMVLVNSAKKVPFIDNVYIEAGVLYVGEDKFPLNGGKILQFR